uniref:Uncharacterized protein n=1 Tax=Oryza nivara TaxID=4536 RepID=A0A0E0FMG8_ORYNI
MCRMWTTTPAVAVADPALLGGVQDFLPFFLPSTRGANGGGEQDVSAARGEEETAASARMRHASCRAGSGRAAARMARRGRSVTAEALQDGVTAGATSDGGGGRFLGAVVGKCAAARGGGVTVGSGDRRGGGRFLGAQDPEHEVVIITAFWLLHGRLAAGNPSTFGRQLRRLGSSAAAQPLGRSHLVRVRLNRSKPQQWRRRGCAPSFEKGPEALSSVEAKPSSSCQNWLLFQ